MSLIKYVALKTKGGVEVQLHAFVTSALFVSASASRPDRSTFREITPRRYSVGGWLGLRAGPDDSTCFVVTLVTTNYINDQN